MNLQINNRPIVEAKIKDIASTYTVNTSTLFETIDSIDVLNLITDLETAFNIQIEDKDVLRFRNIQDIIECVLKKKDFGNDTQEQS